MLATTILTLALAVSAFSITVTRSSATRPLRDYAMRVVPPLGKLLSCPYCISHWAAFAAVLACPVQIVPGGDAINLVIGTFAIVGAAAIITGLAMKLLHVQEEVIARLRDQMAEIVRSIEAGE